MAKPRRTNEGYELHDLHGRSAIGFERHEKPKPGDTTFDVAKLKPRSTELISQDRYDAKHPAQQANQAREDAHSANYNNDVRPSWVRGSNEDATAYPHFDHRNKDGTVKKWNNT